MIFDRTSNSPMVKNPAYDRGRWYQYKIDEEIIGDTPFYRTFESGLNMLVLPPNMVVIDAKVLLERQNIEGVGAETGCTYGQVGYTTYSDTNLSYPAVSLPDPDHMEHIKVYVFGYIDGEPLTVPQDAYWTPIAGAAGGGGGGNMVLTVSEEPGPGSGDVTYTLSRTYRDISDALLSGAIVSIIQPRDEGGSIVYTTRAIGNWGQVPPAYGTNYFVNVGGTMYSAATQDDYPIYIESGPD